MKRVIPKQGMLDETMAKDPTEFAATVLEMSQKSEPIAEVAGSLIMFHKKSAKKPMPEADVELWHCQFAEEVGRRVALRRSRCRADRH